MSRPQHVASKPGPIEKPLLMITKAQKEQHDAAVAAHRAAENRYMRQCGITGFIRAHNMNGLKPKTVEEQAYDKVCYRPRFNLCDKVTHARSEIAVRHYLPGLDFMKDTGAITTLSGDIVEAGDKRETEMGFTGYCDGFPYLIAISDTDGHTTLIGTEQGPYDLLDVELHAYIKEAFDKLVASGHSQSCDSDIETAMQKAYQQITKQINDICSKRGYIINPSIAISILFPQQINKAEYVVKEANIGTGGILIGATYKNRFNHPCFDTLRPGYIGRTGNDVRPLRSTDPHHNLEYDLTVRINALNHNEITLFAISGDLLKHLTSPQVVFNTAHGFSLVEHRLNKFCPPEELIEAALKTMPANPNFKCGMLIYLKMPEPNSKLLNDLKDALQFEITELPEYTQIEEKAAAMKAMIMALNPEANRDQPPHQARMPLAQPPLNPRTPAAERRDGPIVEEVLPDGRTVPLRSSGVEPAQERAEAAAAMEEPLPPADLSKARGVIEHIKRLSNCDAVLRFLFTDPQADLDHCEFNEAIQLCQPELLALFDKIYKAPKDKTYVYTDIRFIFPEETNFFSEFFKTKKSDKPVNDTSNKILAAIQKRLLQSCRETRRVTQRLFDQEMLTGDHSYAPEKIKEVLSIVITPYEKQLRREGKEHMTLANQFSIL